MKTVRRIVAIFVLLACCFLVGYIMYTAKIFGELKDAVSTILWR